MEDDLPEALSAIPRKKRLCYLGDFDEADVTSPTKAQKLLQISQAAIMKHKQVVRNLRKSGKRLKKRVESLEGLLEDLKEKSMISDAASSVLKVSLFDGVSLVSWHYISELEKLQREEGLHAATKIRLRHVQWVMKFLLTYKLSQDHLELFFSAVRSLGGHITIQLPNSFKAAYVRLLAHHEIMTSDSANCTVLDSTNIINVSFAKNIYLNQINGPDDADGASEWNKKVSQAEDPQLLRKCLQACSQYSHDL
ncbi:hypothetical protein JTE90_016370 [Oedothorax gibbosus]|uniref:Transposable element P transposase-like RNase H C-terminal domain-containing protein n=1 Tax=Oedothorax gibbosus TaxID=931172 RepID=A0AAV6U8P4_9ARAC|nr:hypothetical protein JTE90_016370 [Oedothorax gibbosus]